jgi:hypothetical protein
MDAIQRACLVADTIKNTGVDCNKAFGPDAMLFAVPPDFTFDAADLADPLTWMKGLIHNPPATRVFPLFGNKAPISVLDPQEEQDVTVVLDDGSTHFLRYGFSNINYATANGGLCYLKALASLTASGYDVIRMDKSGQLLAAITEDGTGYRALVNNFMMGKAPQNADLKSKIYLNRFMISYDPQDMIDNGVLLAGGRAFLSLTGLKDAEVTADDADSTTTYLEVGVINQCTTEDLIARFGAAWHFANNFVVTNKATGVAVTISGVTTSGGKLRLAGTFTVGQTYVVAGGLASNLFANGITFYEITKSVEITIPA